jgi:hypothetical protein
VVGGGGVVPVPPVVGGGVVVAPGVTPGAGVGDALGAPTVP